MFFTNKLRSINLQEEKKGSLVGLLNPVFPNLIFFLRLPPE